MFALTVPGLGPLLADELAAMAGVTVEARGFDGRADVVLFTAADGSADASLERLALAEDVFVEVGRTDRRAGDRAPWIAERLWRPAKVDAALVFWSRTARRRPPRPTVRVIARVLSERAFLRSELRRELTGTVLRSRPQWRPGDPAELELWVSEYTTGRFVAGLRLSTARMRQHGGRAVERRGALRPAVAAAMIRLAGAPSGLLLDPCCGAGTVLAEAVRAGWRARGLDGDADAVRAARENAPGADVQLGDARRLSLPPDAVAACVSNLPFGRQFQREGDPERWLGAVLGELERVTRPGGAVVLLVPEIPRGAVPRALRLKSRHRLRLLGIDTSIWDFRRSALPAAGG
jgi:23S rRNA G2445 N2-methylase RlmL